MVKATVVVTVILHDRSSNTGSCYYTIDGGRGIQAVAPFRYRQFAAECSKKLVSGNVYCFFAAVVYAVVSKRDEQLRHNEVMGEIPTQAIICNDK